MRGQHDDDGAPRFGVRGLLPGGQNQISAIFANILNMDEPLAGTSARGNQRSKLELNCSSAFCDMTVLSAAEPRSFLLSLP